VSPCAPCNVGPAASNAVAVQRLLGERGLAASAHGEARGRGHSRGSSRAVCDCTRRDAPGHRRLRSADEWPVRPIASPARNQATVGEKRRLGGHLFALKLDAFYVGIRGAIHRHMYPECNPPESRRRRVNQSALRVPTSLNLRRRNHPVGGPRGRIRGDELQRRLFEIVRSHEKRLRFISEEPPFRQHMQRHC
jgi:hypothetical protein